MSRYDDRDSGSWRAPRSRQRASRRRAVTGMMVTGWLAVLVVSVVVVATLGAYVKYRTVWDSIKRIEITGLGKQPPKYNNALNVLLIGSDSRSGANAKIGGFTPGQRSDTVMVLHISPGRHRVTVVSFPRDSVVPILSCPAEASAGAAGQQANPGQIEQINSTFANGGPGCLWKTVEQETGIHLDHFIELDFVGFAKVIDDLGGVEVCLPQAVNDPMSGLHLSAGRHHIMGREATAFWRTREDIGLGSDLQRIQRDQYLMASLVQGIERSGLLNSPSRILSVVGDAAPAMVTDTGLDQTTMLSIAQSMRGLASNSVQFITVPNVPYTGNPNWVQWEQPQAPALFTAIAHDSKLPKAKHSKKQSRQPKTTPVLDATPSKVSVKVLNGAGIGGLAASTAASLTHLGFHVVGTGDTSAFIYSNSVIEYGAATDMPAVNTLKALVSNVTVQQDAGLTPGTVDLIVGSSFTAFKAQTSTAAPKSSRPSVASLSQTYSGITGNANVCDDQQAFSS